MPDKFVVVAANLIVRDGKFLLVQEGKEHVKGQWNLPAGTLEIGEKPVEGAKREAKEETGLVIEPSDLLRTYIAPEDEDPNNVINFVFKTEEAEGEVSIREEDTVIDYGWFTAEEVRDLNLRASYVLAAIDDYKSGKDFPIETFRKINSDLRN